MSKAENPNQGNEIEIISTNQREIELLEKNRKINLQKLFTPEGMDLMIAEIQKEVADFSADISTKEGRAKIISMAAKVAKCKSPIKNLASELKEESRRLIDGVNAQWNRYEAAMDTLRDEIRKPVDEIEEREAAILKSRQDQLKKIEDFKTAIYTSGEASKLYAASIEEVKKLLQFDWGSDWAFRAEIVANEALYILGERLVAAVKYEEEQAELSRLRREAAERAQKDHEEKIAREAAEKAKREAEEAAERERKAAIEREAKIEADKKAAEERAKEAERLAIEQAEKAELARIAAEKKAKEDAEKAALEAVEKERKEGEERERKAIEDQRIAEEKAFVEKRKSQLLAAGLYQDPVGGNFVLLGNDNDIEVFPSEFLAKSSEDDWQKLLDRVAADVVKILEKRQKARLQKIEDDKKKAAREAVEKERLRLAEEKRLADLAAEKLAANKRHRAKINREAAKAIEEILNACEEDGVEFETIDKKIISAIENGLVPHVQINY